MYPVRVTRMRAGGDDAVSDLQERDVMICRSCGNQERASEGYPCKDCGTFICIMCVFKGVVRCATCATLAAASGKNEGGTKIEWPEH